MPATSPFDVKYLDNLALPYDTATKELDPSPRYVDGANLYITVGGKLALAPGVNETGLSTYTLTKRPDNHVVYETIESPPKIYQIASVFNTVTGFYEAWYARVGTTVWTTLGTLRDLDKSTKPHEFLVARGLCFIKAFPDAAHDKLGCVIFDGTSAGPRVLPWGVLPPTIAARAVAQGSWAASTNPVTVLFGWKYVYAWKDLLGNYSCRSPLETDPSQNQSTTGAFTNLKPQMVIQGLADTTNFPLIGIFRTTDGGGTFCFVEDIANTGAGNITYTDQHRVPSNTNNPLSDLQLDAQNIAPSLVSNLPPPSVSPGKVQGTDPVEPSTPMAYFANRIWYGIQRVYFSGREEILNGVPEECWPAHNGIRGDYYVVQGQPRLLKEAGGNYLYILTSNEQLYVTGQDRSNLYLWSTSKNTSGAVGHPRAACALDDSIFFLTQDLQVARYLAPTSYSRSLQGSGAGAQIISMSIGTTLRTAINASATTSVHMDIWIRDGNKWLIVAVVDTATPANTKLFVFDIQRSLWFVPWNKKVATITFGRLSEADPNKHLVILRWDGTTARLGVLDPTVFTDGADLQPAPFVTTNLMLVPAGNHVNPLSIPVLTPIISYLLTERTKFTNDTDPTVNVRLEEFSVGAFTPLTGFPPKYRAQKISYNTLWWPIEQAAQRIQMQVQKVAANEAFELQNLGFIFKPDAGT